MRSAERLTAPLPVPPETRPGARARVPGCRSKRVSWQRLAPRGRYQIVLGRHASWQPTHSRCNSAPPGEREECADPSVSRSQAGAGGARQTAVSAPLSREPRELHEILRGSFSALQAPMLPMVFRGAAGEVASYLRRTGEKERQIAGKRVPDFFSSNILVLSCTNQGYLPVLSPIPGEEEYYYGMRMTQTSAE